MPEPMPSVSTLRAITDAFNRHDLDAIMAFFADDAVFESPRGRDPHGRRSLPAMAAVAAGQGMSAVCARPGRSVGFRRVVGHGRPQ